MRVEVLLNPADLLNHRQQQANHSAWIGIDLLRATSVMVTALKYGAQAIFPVESLQAARALQATQPTYLLAGEVDSERPDGFAFGNSPVEFEKYARKLAGQLKDQQIIMATTNGTKLLQSIYHHAPQTASIYAGALLNRAALAQQIKSSKPDTLTLCCAGRKGQFSLEDAYCAGKIIEGLKAIGIPIMLSGDGSLAALSLAEQFPDPFSLLSQCAQAKRLEKIGLEADVGYCSQLDTTDIIPCFDGTRLTARSAN